MRWAIRVLAMTIAAGAVAVPAHADAQELLVTYAARSCPSYTDVFANLARNNIQESLRDLGPDTPYVNGEPITPAKDEPVSRTARRWSGGASGWAGHRRRAHRHVGVVVLRVVALRHQHRHADLNTAAQR